MEDIFWAVQQFTGALFNARSLSATHWRDSAERDISTRYLDSLFDHADDIKTEMQRMNECILLARRELHEADRCFVTAREAAKDVANAIDSFDDYIQSANGLLSSAELSNQRAYGELLDFNDWLTYADEVGSYAPAESGQKPIAGAEAHLIQVYKAKIVDTAIPGLGAVDMLLSPLLGQEYDPHRSELRVISQF